MANLHIEVDTGESIRMQLKRAMTSLGATNAALAEIGWPPLNEDNVTWIRACIRDARPLFDRLTFKP